MIYAYILLFTGIILVLIAICREIVCWYLKITDIVKILEKIQENTKKS